MTFASSVRNCWGNRTRSTRKVRATAAWKRFRSLCFESLEARLALATTLNVTSPADYPGFVIPNDGTLRGAFLAANSINDQIVIKFSSILGKATIYPTQGLPTLTRQVTIDGENRITLDGSSGNSGQPGIVLEGNNSIVKNLTIRNFGGNGIGIRAASGVRISQNTIIDNGGHGIFVRGPSGPHFITDNIIYGPGRAIGLGNNGVTGVVIQNNRIGTSVAGSPGSGTEYGIVVYANSPNNVIQNNTIASATKSGIWIQSGSGGTQVLSNVILDNDQHGILIASGANGNTIRQNTIINNGWNGINAVGQTSDTIVGNSFSTTTSTANSNGRNALDEGRTAIVNVILHGFDPAPGQLASPSATHSAEFMLPFENLAFQLTQSGEVPEELRGRVHNVIPQWDSTSFFGDAFVHLLIAEVLLAKADTLSGRERSLALASYSEYASVAAAAAAAADRFVTLTANRVVQQLVTDANLLVEADHSILSQRIHLVGHSRGAAVAVLVARELARRGYTNLDLTFLDGYGADWNHDGGLLSKLNLGELAAPLAGIPRFNLRANTGLALDPAIDNLIVTGTIELIYGPASVALSQLRSASMGILIGSLPNLRAPERSGFTNVTLVGGPGPQGTYHTTITPFFASQSSLYGSIVPGGLPGGSDSTSASVGEVRGAEAFAASPANGPAGASVAYGFSDGTLDRLGELASLLASYEPSGDSELDAAHAELSQAQAIVGTSWSNSGDVRLVTVDGDTWLSLRGTQGNAHIAQEVALPERISQLEFALRVLSAGVEDRLEVYRDGLLISSLALLTQPTTSQQSIALTERLDGASSFEFRLVTANASTEVLLDDFCITSPPNTAPVIADLDIAFPDVSPSRNAGSNLGALVSDLALGVTDGDDGARRGIAITHFNPAIGLFQYSLDGSTWKDVLDVSDSESLLLPADGIARVRFLPTPGLTGLFANAITFKAWDQSRGLAQLSGELHDTTVSGSESPFSIDSEVARLTILPNQAPVLASSNALASAFENQAGGDGTLVRDLLLGTVVDADAGALQGLAVISVDVAAGVWEYRLSSSDPWTAIGSVSAANALLLPADNEARIRLRPSKSLVGTVSNALSFHAWDQTGVDSAGDRVAVSATGGTAAFSEATHVAAIDILDPPRVTGVFARGTNWSSSFLDYLASQGLGDSAMGVRVSSGAAQLSALPWVNIDRIAIQFNETVSIDGTSLQLVGERLGEVDVSNAAFEFDPSRNAAIWTLTEPLPVDKLILGVRAVSVLDSRSNQLDGEWITGVSVYSGNNGTGGDWTFRLNVVPGDIDDSQGVVFSEVARARLKIGRTTADSDYNFRQDVDGSGGITFSDVAQARLRVGSAISGLPEPVIVWPVAAAPSPLVGESSPAEYGEVNESGAVVPSNREDSGDADSVQLSASDLELIDSAYARLSSSGWFGATNSRRRY